MLNNNLTANSVPFRFGYDAVKGKYGYILSEGGADTVIPFSSGEIKECIFNFNWYSMNYNGFIIHNNEVVKDFNGTFSAYNGEYMNNPTKMKVTAVQSGDFGVYKFQNGYTIKHCEAGETIIEVNEVSEHYSMFMVMAL